MAYKLCEYGAGGSTYTAGDGIDITDDTISVDEMPDTDMEEIITPLPSIMSRRFKYSTAEQVVGEWIDGKPLYQRTYDLGSGPNNTNITWPHNIDNLDKAISFVGVMIGTSSTTSALQIPLNFCPANTTAKDATWIRINGSNIQMGTGADRSMFNIYLTLQYTKTTDQVNS